MASQPHRHDDAPYLYNLLGYPPELAEALTPWNAAANVIHAYRQRWGVTDFLKAFGHTPSHPRQRDERDIATNQVRGYVESMRQAERLAELSHATAPRRAKEQLEPVAVPHLPLQPLIKAMPIDWVVVNEKAKGPKELRQAAAMLGIPVRTLYRYRNDGINFWSADRLAIKAGLHPLVVWGDEWIAAERAVGCSRESLDRSLG